MNRATRPVRVTDAGARLLRHTAAVLGNMAAAEDELRAIAGLQSGTLRLGAFLSACNSFVPAALARFEAAHPDVDVHVEQLEEPEALRRLRTGDLDVAVVWRVWEPAHQRDKDPDEGFDQLHLADDPYRVALPAGHPLARRRALELADLAKERFNVPRAAGVTLPYRTMLDQLCAEAGFEPDIAYVVQDVTVARAFVASGLSVALMPELTIPEPRSDVALRPVRGIDPFRSIHATWLRERRVPSVAPIVRYLAEAAEARLGRGS